MNTLTKEILELIEEIAKSIKYQDIYNERYLHHFFTHELQNKHSLLNLTNDDEIILHPEWPTSKSKTGIHYTIDKNNIDFAIGNYDKPDIGIEFTLKDSWNHKEIVGDFVKLLDKNIPFQVSISFNLIIRQNKLVDKGWLQDLVEHMNGAYKEATEKLNNNFDISRDLYLIITEIDKENRRHWYFDKVSTKFIGGLPEL